MDPFAEEEDTLPPVKIGPDGKRLFDNETQALANHENPSISYMAKQELWVGGLPVERTVARTPELSVTSLSLSLYVYIYIFLSLIIICAQRSARRAQRDHWKSVDATVARLYCTADVPVGGGESTSTSGGSSTSAGMEGRFECLTLRVDAARGSVHGEGRHATVGDFRLEGRVKGSGFATYTDLDTTVLWQVHLSRCAPTDFLAPSARGSDPGFVVATGRTGGTTPCPSRSAHQRTGPNSRPRRTAEKRCARPQEDVRRRA